MGDTNLCRLTKREFLRLTCLGAGACVFNHPAFVPLLDQTARAAAEAGTPDDPDKWSIEARYFVASGKAIRCLKCPNGCVLGRGQTGKCRNRVNHEGRLYSIAYGNPCAVHVDPIEKKPLFHFLPSTRAFSIAVAGCNLRCLNCQNWQISQVSPRDTQNADLMPDRVVDEAEKTGCASIAYTYSEPTTFYEYAFDTAARARKRNIRNVWKSNGYINEEPLRDLCRVIDAANIDLKSFDERSYRDLNGGSLAPVLAALKVFKEQRVWLEITNLVVPTWTDDLAMIRRMCDWLCENGLRDCPLHFSRFTPMYKLTQLPLTPVSTLERAREIALEAGLRYVYIGNVPGHGAEDTLCPRCSATVVQRRGFVVLKNTLKGGRCGSCGEMIPGVWS